MVGGRRRGGRCEVVRRGHGAEGEGWGEKECGGVGGSFVYLYICFGKFLGAWHVFPMRSR